MTLKQFIEISSQWAAEQTQFIFITDYELKNLQLFKINEAAQNGIYYDLNSLTNFTYWDNQAEIELHKKHFDQKDYRIKFNILYQHLINENIAVANLTFATPIEINKSLREIFNISKAPYKLLFKDQFVVFSPESFIRITGNKIYSYPMKGTIDASLKNAERLLLNNKKEYDEHRQVVDLMETELAKVAAKINTERFRYIQEIKTLQGNILQTSSEISGELTNNWKENFGNILVNLLPAGSISGTPKEPSINIIKKVEDGKRGYYTGVFGVFDGENLDSGVMIRYIEQKDGKYYYRSGGGITLQSDPEKEYQELIQKIYVPTI